MRLDELPPDVLETLAAQASAINKLREDVNNLAQALAALTSTQGSKKGPCPWAWRYLTDQNQAETLWAQVGDFAAWLQRTYLDEAHIEVNLPQCWRQHPLLVEELTALMLAWQAAYTDGSTEPNADPAYWHERYLPDFLSRLHPIDRLCLTGHHSPTVHSIGPPDPEAFKAFLPASPQELPHERPN